MKSSYVGAATIAGLGATSPHAGSPLAALVERGVDPLVLRLAFLRAPHREPLALSWEEIHTADAAFSINGYPGIYDAAAHGATGTATGVASSSLMLLSVPPALPIRRSYRQPE